MVNVKHYGPTNLVTPHRFRFNWMESARLVHSCPSSISLWFYVDRILEEQLAQLRGIVGPNNVWLPLQNWYTSLRRQHITMAHAQKWIASVQPFIINE